MDEKRSGATPSDDLGSSGNEPDRSDPVFDLPLNLSREAPPEEPGRGEEHSGDASDSADGSAPDRSGTITVIVIAGLILVGGGAVIWWWLSSRSADPVDPDAVAAVAGESSAPEPSAAPPAADPPAPEPPPPALSESDSLVRDVVAGLSEHAQWMTWLVPEELAMNFVRAVAAVAYDEPPQSSLEPLRPDEGFSVVRRGQRFYPAETSFRRYNLAVEIFDSIDVAGIASAYGRLEPLFEQAHDELGYPNEFGDTLERAVTRLLATPIPDAPPELRLRVISFEYVDPGLEGLSPAQTLLLRLGPDNGDRVRAKVRELYAALP